MRSLLRAVSLAVLATVSLGCRLPKLYLATNEQTPLRYDTALARSEGEVRLASGEVSAAVVDRYRDTLAEPVAVIEWQPGVSSTWQILYATNRGQSGDVPRRGPRYGNTVVASPEYGVCAVTLPHRERGKDGPTTSEKSSRWTRWLGRGTDPSAAGEAPTDATGEVEIVQPLEEEMFFTKLQGLVDQSRQRDVLVFVHGFNVSYEQAVLRATQVAADMPFNGAIVVYAWPSQGGVDNYERDGEVIDESRMAFVHFLTQLGERLPASVDINVLVHSMGNRLVTRSVWYLPDTFTDPPRFREMVFCAPDVSVDEFKRNARRVVDVCERATLYKNCNDAALIASKWRNLEERAGEAFQPILMDGLDTIETTVVDTSLLGHSYYGSNTSILRDLFAIIKEHQPAAEREWLQRKTIPFVEHPWWILARFPREIEWTWHFDEHPSSDIVPVSAGQTAGHTAE